MRCLLDKKEADTLILSPRNSCNLHIRMELSRMYRLMTSLEGHQHLRISLATGSFSPIPGEHTLKFQRILSFEHPYNPSRLHLVEAQFMLKPSPFFSKSCFLNPSYQSTNQLHILSTESRNTFKIYPSSPKSQHGAEKESSPFLFLHYQLFIVARFSILQSHLGLQRCFTWNDVFDQRGSS